MTKNRTHGEVAKKSKLAPRDRLTDHEVELARALHEEHPRSHPQHLGWRRLAKKFGVSRSTMKQYLTYARR